MEKLLQRTPLPAVNISIHVTDNKSITLQSVVGVAKSLACGPGILSLTLLGKQSRQLYKPKVKRERDSDAEGKRERDREALSL